MPSKKKTKKAQTPKVKVRDLADAAENEGQKVRGGIEFNPNLTQQRLGEVHGKGWVNVPTHKESIFRR